MKIKTALFAAIGAAYIAIAPGCAHNNSPAQITAPADDYQRTYSLLRIAKDAADSTAEYIFVQHPLLNILGKTELLKDKQIVSSEEARNTLDDVVSYYMGRSEGWQPEERKMAVTLLYQIADYLEEPIRYRLVEQFLQKKAEIGTDPVLSEVTDIVFKSKRTHTPIVQSLGHQGMRYKDHPNRNVMRQGTKLIEECFDAMNAESPSRVYNRILNLPFK